MRIFRNVASCLLRDDSGQDLIEYALLAGLMGLGAVAAMIGSQPRAALHSPVSAVQ